MTTERFDLALTVEEAAQAHGSVRAAVKIWSSRQDHFGYNDWQGAYFAFCKMPGYTDEGAVEGETQTQRQARMKEMYEAAA